MKKLFKLMLVLALVITQFIGIAPVDAAETTGSIKIDASATTQTRDNDVEYKIYKVFDLSLNETGNAYRYTITSTSPWYAFFNEGAGSAYVVLSASEPAGTYVVTWTGSTEETNKAELAKAALAYAEDKEIAATRTATIEKGQETTTETGLELGYYLVDSTLGALCALTTTDRNAEITEKNFVPDVKKEVNENGTFGSTSNAQIGDKVEYKTTITVAAGAVNYVLYDTMTTGLTFNNDIEIKVGTTPLVKDTDYTVSTAEGKTFVVIFKNETIKKLSVGDQIVVTYSATLNENAEIKDSSNDNTTYLTYGDSNEFETKPETTKTYSFKFDLVKTDVDDNILEGAKFKLYRKVENQNVEVPVIKLEDGTYRVAVGDEKGEEIEAGYVTIKGLDGNTTYYLEETVAPEGYNRLTDPVEFTIGTNNISATVTLDQETQEPSKYVEGGIEVENTTGTKLPETGGMGTVMFITVGSLMVMGFGVLLVTKLRLSKES